MTNGAENEPILLDTNILIYALDRESPLYEVSRSILEGAATGDRTYCIASQSLAEFFSVVTNPRRVKAPRSAVEAIEAIERILALPGLTLLPNPREATTRWIDMIRRNPVTGADAFDVQLAATALASGVARICTFNSADFQRIDGIQVMIPSA